MENLGNKLLEWTLPKKTMSKYSLRILIVILTVFIYLFFKASSNFRNQLILIFLTPVILITAGVVLNKDRNVKLYSKGLIVDKRKKYLWDDIKEWAFFPSSQFKSEDIIIYLKSTFKEAWGEEKNFTNIIPLLNEKSLNNKICKIFESKLGKQSENIKSRYPFLQSS